MNNPAEKKNVVRHGPNKKGRDFVVGDIHGQLTLLNHELEKVGFDKSVDRLFSVGDLIDRGQESFDCLSLPFEPWFHGVVGNHEIMAIEGLTHGKGRRQHWIDNGGYWIYGEDEKEVKSLLGEALHYLPLAREVRTRDGHTLGIVHAEPPADWNGIDYFAKTNGEYLMWSRNRHDRENHSFVTGVDAVIVGHTIVPEPTWFGNVHYIDTGAFVTGKMTLKLIDDVIRDVQKLAALQSRVNAKSEQDAD